jgi:hypothetical protein
MLRVTLWIVALFAVLFVLRLLGFVLRGAARRPSAGDTP